MSSMCRECVVWCLIARGCIIGLIEPLTSMLVLSSQSVSIDALVCVAGIGNHSLQERRDVSGRGLLPVLYFGCVQLLKHR